MLTSEPKNNSSTFVVVVDNKLIIDLEAYMKNQYFDLTIIIEKFTSIIFSSFSIL